MSDKDKEAPVEAGPNPGEPGADALTGGANGLHAHIKTMMLAYMSLQALYLAVAALSALIHEVYPYSGIVSLCRVIMRVLIASTIATLITFLVVAGDEYRRNKKNGTAPSGVNAIYNILSSTVLVAAIYFVVFYLAPESHWAALGWYWATGLFGHLSVIGLLMGGGSAKSPDAPIPPARTKFPAALNVIFLIVVSAVYWRDILKMFH